MEIITENIGKKFNKEWIFRKISFSIKTNESIAITGHNGSGKSTFLQLISGALLPTEGSITYLKDNQEIAPETIYQHLTYTAPYLELIEEMSVTEFVEFQKEFKPFQNNLSSKEFIEKINLTHAQNKQIRLLSSGMKQRLKLGISLYNNSSLLLLDEPTSNLDSIGIDWYREEIAKKLNHQTILICSNQRHEYEFCDRELKITDFKK